jgi:putative endopeptidase
MSLPTNQMSTRPIELQLGRFYAGCMDQPTINERGLQPLEPILRAISRAKNLQQLFRTAGALVYTSAVSLFFSFGIGVNLHAPERYIVAVSQGGVPLSTRELLIGPTNVTVPYTNHIARMYTLAGEGEEEARERARRVVDFQVELAKLWQLPEQMRDPEKLDHPVRHRFGARGCRGERRIADFPVVSCILCVVIFQTSISDLASSTRLDFEGYFKRALNNRTLSPDVVVNVDRPEYFVGLARLLHQTPLATLKEYANWIALNGYSTDLPRSFVKEHFTFFGRFLTGTPRQSARWRVCQAKALGLMSDALSARYVDVAFSPKTERRVRQMLEHVRLAFLRRLPDLRWMTPEDKLQAADKLTGMFILIGATAPSKRLNYTGVALNPSHHLENVQRLARYDYDQRLKRMWGRVERDRFQMTASQVNASVRKTERRTITPVVFQS